MVLPKMCQKTELQHKLRKTKVLILNENTIINNNATNCAALLEMYVDELLSKYIDGVEILIKL